MSHQFSAVKFSAAVAAALMALAFAASPARALIMNFGELEVSLDTVLSSGVSLRTIERETRYLNVVNGGPLDRSLMLSAPGRAFALGVEPAFGAFRSTSADLQAAMMAGDQDAIDEATAAQTDALMRLTAAGQPFAAAIADAGGGAAGANAVYTRFQAAAMATPCGLQDTPTGYALTNGTSCLKFGSQELYNYDGSINTDDGRLNFDQGDVIGAPFKITPEIALSYGDWRAFVRATAFWDVVLEDANNYERSGPLFIARDDMVRDVRLLDAYVSKDGEFLGNPYTVRIGRQVINWGEATFVPGGVTAFNPIDVTALRRPGTELKEVFLPVEAAQVSWSLPGDITLEGYYGGWESFRIDKAGFPFADGDGVFLGSSATGNATFLAGGLFGGLGKVNCDVFGTRLAAMLGGDAAAVAAGPTTRAIYRSLQEAAKLGGRTVFGTPWSDILARNNCDQIQVNADLEIGDTPMDARTAPLTPGIAHNIRHTEGRAEAQRLGYDDPSLIHRQRDEAHGINSGSWGVALRWYAEALNSTEFGFYFQNYDSRIPYVNLTSANPTFAVTTTTPTSTIQGRLLNNVGCETTALTIGGAVAQGLLPGSRYSGLTPAELRQALLQDFYGHLLRVPVADPTGLLSGTASGMSLAEQALAQTEAAAAYRARLTAAATELVPGGAGGIIAGAFLGQGYITPKYTDGTNEWGNGLDANGNPKQLSGARVAEIACRSHIGNASDRLGAGQELDHTGAMTFGSLPELGLRLEYPENIQSIGGSFNTTLFGWGVQGELAFRPNFPLQLDTDELTIGALVSGCSFALNYGVPTSDLVTATAPSDFATILTGLSAVFAERGLGCTADFVEHQGYVKEDVLNFNIGTTATFTRSNPAIRMLGADLGILLTEAAGVYADNIDRRRAGNVGGNGQIPLFNNCTSGTEIPLGGVFSLDPRPLHDCRPTEFSMGLVLFGQLQYNSVFGTAFGLRPGIAWSQGVLGRSPIPAGNWAEGVGSISLSLAVEYLNDWSGSFSYTHFTGDRLYSRALDRNFASFSLSYAF